MGIFRVSELAKVARSTSVEAFERLLGPLTLLGPADLDPGAADRRFGTQVGVEVSESGTLPGWSRLLEGVARPLRRSPERWTAEPWTASLEEDAVTIGRARTSDIRLPHPSVSKFHAEVRRGPARPQASGESLGLTLTDVGSTNGTRVDDEVVAAGDAVELRDGQRLRLGEVELAVFDPARLHALLVRVEPVDWLQRSG